MRAMGQGQPLAGDANALAHENRLTLLSLAEQVARIAEQLDRLLGSEGVTDHKTVMSDGSDAHSMESGDLRESRQVVDRIARAARPPLPDPRLVRKIIRQRQLRARFFDGELFADPAWDILLDLAAARAEHRRVSVTSLCIASGVPPTTALRWIGQMIEDGLLARTDDEADRRRAFVVLTDKAVDAIARYFFEAGRQPLHLV